ncbi:tartrate dehydrogenase [Coniochaeta ligniaria NRRL 30616]|uniref:D-malate dehydrogenase (decarboxylating) n=1 Tax=Coniochaeta ligniaria NRRL 30616 TaxID=1408157 RepID=A0A1J7JQV8_9PEZI|nr:tartrate dehydrogenase [Coniochaeta ligniaria NRRL 30616]
MSRPQKRTYRIASIPGDGIGVEVIEQTVKVLRTMEDLFGSFTLDIDMLDWSSDRYLEKGEYIPADAWPKLRASDAILFGAVGSPDVPDDISLWDLILPLRKKLNQYINLRPIRILPGVSSPLRSCTSSDLDWMIVRENSEGEYAGQGGTTHDDTAQTIATEVAIFTRLGIERTMRFAFDIARDRPRKKLTMVTKSNAQRHGMVLWDKIFYEVAKEYPDVETDKMLVDAMTVRMVLKPQTLDTIVATNLHGDILSDLAAALAGSIGVAASSNLDPTRQNPSMFEPIHGSAPDIAGQGIANPIGTFWSAAEMLRWLGEEGAADLLMKAMETVTASGTKTRDVGGTCNLAQVTEAVIAELEQLFHSRKAGDH